MGSFEDSRFGNRLEDSRFGNRLFNTGSGVVARGLLEGHVLSFFCFCDLRVLFSGVVCVSSLVFVFIFLHDGPASNCGPVV